MNQLSILDPFQARGNLTEVTERIWSGAQDNGMPYYTFDDGTPVRETFNLIIFNTAHNVSITYVMINEISIYLRKTRFLLPSR